MSRISVLGPQDRYLLDQWVAPIRFAYEADVYLVGSAVGDGPARDVDVRAVLDDDLLLRMLHRDALVAHGDLRFATLNVAFTEWGRRATRLPIDFQFQPSSELAEHADRPRIPLGLRW